MSNTKTANPKGRKMRSASQPRRGSESLTKERNAESPRRATTPMNSPSNPVGRGSSTSRPSIKKVTSSQPLLKSTDSKKDIFSDPRLDSKLKALIQETLTVEISDTVAEKTREVAHLAGELASQVKHLVRKVSELETALVQKGKNEEEMNKRITHLEEQIIDLESSPSRVSENRQSKSEPRQPEVYLDEMERIMLKKVKIVLEQRHSSVPRDFETKQSRKKSITALFTPRRSKTKDKPLASLRITDLLGRWQQEGGDATHWTVSSDGSALSGTNMKIVLKERGQHGVWTVDRSDEWTLDVASDPLSCLHWRGVGRNSNFIQIWKRYLVSEVSFFIESPAQREEDEEQGDNETNEEDEQELMHEEEQDGEEGGRKDVASRRRAPSRPSSIKFFKVMRKGVLPKVLARQLVKAAQIIEPKMTTMLTEIAKDADGELVGLDYRFKTLESLQLKIGRDVHDANLKILEDMEKRRAEVAMAIHLMEGHEKKQKLFIKAAEAIKAAKLSNKEREERKLKNQQEAEEAAAKVAKKLEEEVMRIETQAEAEGKNDVDIAGLVWDISDALRYTMLIKTENYTETVRNAIKKLEAAGMTPASLKNYWGEGDGYQGINDVFFVPSELSPNGLIKVEIQFHTQESFDHKMAVHGMYEEFRSTKDPARKVELWQESVAMADTIPVPKDVLSIPYLKTQPMPIENTLYVDLILSRALKIEKAAVAAVTKLCSNIKLPGVLTSSVVSGTVTPVLMSPSAVEKQLISEMARRRRSINPHTHAHGEGGGGCDVDDPEETERGLKEAALNIQDTLVINVVFEDRFYSRATEAVLAALFVDSEFTEEHSVSSWGSPLWFERNGPTGGLGIYSHVTMEGEDDGVAFTPDDAYPLVIAFHTAESQTARTGIQAAWSEYRAANTSRQRQAAVVRARRRVEAVKIPKGAKTVLSHRWLHEKGHGISGIVMGSVHNIYESVGSNL